MSEVNDLDRRVLAAIWREPRASYTSLAASLDVEERTVRGSLDRLQASGLLCFSSTVLHENTDGWLVAQVELLCRPGMAGEVAAAMTSREDTRFVAVTTGGADVVADLVVADTAALHEVLAAELGQLAGVVSIRTQVVVRLLFTAVDWDPEGLLDRRRAKVRSGPSTAVAQPLDETDRAIAEALRSDPRMPGTRIAKALDIHETTVQRRLKRMIASTALEIRADVPPAAMGFPVEARFSIAVRPEDLDAALSRLSEEPALRALYWVTGPSSILGLSVHRSVADLQSLYQGAFARVPGLLSTDLALILQVYKRSGTPQRQVSTMEVKP